MRLIKFKTDLNENDVTPKDVFVNRRQLFAGSALAAMTGAMPSLGFAKDDQSAIHYSVPTWLEQQLASSTLDENQQGQTLTPYKDVTSYNNFYEFGTHKSHPKIKSKQFQPHPWQVKVAGHCENAGVFDLEDLLKGLSVQERIYRLRCVEGWSMVIPWMGVPLAQLLKKMQPTSKAKYVEFITLDDKKQFPATASQFSTIDFPYREGLRMDEAMHPLSLMAIGLYGEALPAQNGAPMRLVVPWKYGFKSIKSIVEIRFVEQQPSTTWSLTAPKEYGFYANVNPEVDHPRWSQKTERRLPNSLFSANRIKTQLFNGYTEVAELYKDMDLRKYY